MKTNVVGSLGEPVGRMWQSMQDTGALRVAAPLSSTPLPIYRWLVEHARTMKHWADVHFVLMDEQVEGDTQPFHYVASDDAASYEGFARRHFLDPLTDACGARPAVVKPDLEHLDEFNQPIDLLILAIGPRGNYANVMPGTPEDVGWHIAELSEEFRTAHTKQTSQSYAGAQFRTHGMSLGPQQVLQAARVAVIASGESKRDLVTELLARTEFDPEFPISIVNHADVANRVELFMTPDMMEH